MILDLPTIRSQVSGPEGGRLRHVRQFATTSDVLFPSPRITAALRFGTPQRRTFLGDLLMPDFVRDQWKVLVISEDDSHLIVYDTERALQEPRKRGKFVQSTTEFEMAAFGFEYGLDRRLRTRVAEQAFFLEVGAARRAQDAVRLDHENRKALLLSTPANWPAAHASDESGAPWDGVGGDVKASIDAAIVQIQSVHPGYQREDFNLRLTQAAWEAAQADPTWAAIRANFTDAFPLVSDLERYLGFRPGSVAVGDATVSVNGTVQSLWGEGAWVTINTPVEELDTTFGSDVFALNHVMGGGNAFPPYFEDRPTTDWYPFEALALPVVHDYTAGFFMYDMKA